MENKKQGAFACASDEGHQAGLTKREYFAGIAMQACLTSGFHLNASDWVRIADALLRELDKSE
jgi:hypothetical protein